MLNFKRLCLLILFMKPLDAMLSLCDTPSGYLEVREGRHDNTFTCSGPVSGLTVQWRLNYTSMNYLGICYPNTTCTSKFTGFNIMRTEDTASLIVDETGILQKDVFYTTSVLCQAYSENHLIDETRCPLDLISPPKTPSCSLQITNTTWKLTGQCDVSKVRSARGRYYCLLYQNSQPNWTLLGKFNMSTTPGADSIYSSGNCQISTSLPPQGTLTYTVVIVPGEVLVSPSFTGSYKIRRPSGSPTHNCPQYVQESLGLRCYCNANDLGSPQGSVVWNDVNSSELKIDSVNRTMSGMNFTCNLMWNKTVVQTVTYSPIVNYSSSVLSFKIADKEASTVNISQNANVPVVCEADGRPLPTIRLLKVTDGDSETLVEATTQVLVLGLTDLQCESAATYVCQSENIVKGRDERRIELTVTCRPSESPTHNCPPYVQESRYCNANDLGSPQGSVVWNNVNSSELKIDSVNRTMSGMNFTCNLMWNNTVVQTVTYSPIVNYSASVLSFKIADKEASTVEVSQNTNVPIVCEADGRPLPTIRLLIVTDGDSETLVEATTQVLALSMIDFQCESDATYVCQSENIVKGRDERRIELTVTCAPKLSSANPNDTYTTTFKGDEATLDFQMISRPAPDALSIFYTGSLPHDTSNRSVENVSATVTLRNKANFSDGFHSAVFSNNLGNLSFTFEIKEQDQETTGSTVATGPSQRDITGPVAGGLVGAVVAIAVVVVVIILIVRRKGRKDKPSAPIPMESTDNSVTQKGSENGLQQEDVNSPSVYQMPGDRHETSKDHGDPGKWSVYEIPADTEPPKKVTATHQGDTAYQNYM